MTALTLDKAKQIIDAAFAKGTELKLRPFGVSILDAGAILSRSSARTAPRSCARRCRRERPMARSPSAWVRAGSRLSPRSVRIWWPESRMCPAAGSLPVVGGVLIRDKAGAIIGAVGISGDTSDNDEAAAIAGIEAAGLTADPG